MPRRPTARLRFTRLEDRLTPASGLDPTFGTGGIAHIAVPNNSFLTNTVEATLADGSVLVAATSDIVGTRVGKLTPLGAADPSFGTAGIAPVGSGHVTGRPVAMTAGADGSVYLLMSQWVTVYAFPGSTLSTIVPRTMLYRLAADGSAVPGFPAEGVAVGAGGFDDGRSHNGPNLTVRTDGSVAVAEGWYGGGTVTVFTPTGERDTTFGVNGEVTVPVAGNPWSDNPNLLAVEGNRLLVVGGADGGQTVAIRLTENGAIDTGYGTAGRAVLTEPGELVLSGAVTTTPDGALAVGVLAGDHVQVRKLTADGVADVTFGTAGRVDLPPVPPATGWRAQAFPGLANAGPYGAALSVRADGGLLVATSHGFRQVTLDSMTPTGAVDTSFGGDGRRTVADVLSLTEFFSQLVPLAGGRLAYLSGAASAAGGLSVAALAAYDDPADPEGPVIDPPVSDPPVSDLPVLSLPMLYPPDAWVPISGKYLPDVGVPISGKLPPAEVKLPNRVAGDLDGDGTADKVVTAGPTVSVVSGADGHTLLPAFAPFEASYTGSLNAVLADVDGDGRAELIVSPDQGGGPVVAVYKADGTQVGRFWGIEDANFRGGVRLAGGDLNGDGMSDLVVTAGDGGGPRVAVFDGRTLMATARRLVGDFFAFEEGQRGGAFAVVADGQLVFGAGRGGGPRVRTVDAHSLLAMAPKTLDELPAAARRLDRFVGDPEARAGAKVTVRFNQVVADAGDGRPQVVYDFVLPGLGIDPIDPLVLNGAPVR